MTKFGLWVRENSLMRTSARGLSVTNLDFVFEDFQGKNLMLVEEKTRNGKLHRAQLKTFKVLDTIVRAGAASQGYDYRGFFLIQFVEETPESGCRINGVDATPEQLANHLNFFPPYRPSFDFDTKDKSLVSHC